MYPFPNRIENPRYTLGVVISVPEPLRTQLHHWRVRYGAADSEQVAPHITLVTGSYRGTWEAAAEHVARVCAEQRGFTVRLGPAQSFRPVTQVTYLPLEVGERVCHQLHQSLVNGPLVHDSAYSYHPHLTIAQNVPDAQLERALADLAQVRLDFAVTEVQLFDMRHGEWNLSQSFTLT